MAYLKFLNGPHYNRLVALPQDLVCRIGRDPSLEISLDDPKASRVHVEVAHENKAFILKDLHSKNGTLLNGQRVTTPVTLQEFDELQIGETRLRYLETESSQQAATRKHDSIQATRVPKGVVKVSGEDSGFETLELSADLPLLRLSASLRDKQDRDKTALLEAISLDRANRCLRALYAIARAGSEAQHSRALMTELALHLETAIEADRVTPLVATERGWEPAVLPRPGSLGQTERKRQEQFQRIPVSRTIVEYAIKSRRSVLTVPAQDERFENARSVGEQGICSAICVPILSEDRIAALLYADRLSGEPFDREDHELVTAACLQIGPTLLNIQRLEDALARKERLIQSLKQEHRIVGECEAMQAVFAFIERAAPFDSAVLILGESGTGKELVARAMHYNSKRSDGPLVVVNCAALSEALIESELFGHAKGAFTGATGERAGRFELADGGSIFLDEIGELPPNCQSKLLRVLEQGEVSRVGESRVRKVNVRLIAATNRELEEEVRAGRFRQDLFYRLNVLAIELPPLRARGGDLQNLLNYYLQQAAEKCGRSRLAFSDEALAALLQYAWPGNVRELKNLTERLAVMCPHEIVGVRDLPREIEPHPAANSASQVVSAHLPYAPQTLAVVEKKHILETLEFCNGNKKQAAELLGIDRSTLYAKLRAFGILARTPAEEA